MSARFNPPPLWLQHLPANFQPSIDWIPEAAWGAPPVGWAMWVEADTGYPTAPPEEFRNNAYLYMSVMPDFSAQSAPTAAIPVPAKSGAAAPVRFSTPDYALANPDPAADKKPMRKGLKITLWVVGGITLASILGSCVGGDDETPPATPPAATTEAPASPTVSIDPAVEAADASAKAEADASAKAEADASAKAEAKAEASAKAEAEASAKAEAEAEAKAEAEASAKAEAEAGTLSQQNALRAAASYLEYTAFSRTSLIEQLEFEEYSKKDATWAVDRVTVDWNEQAVKSAESYLDYTAFSRKGLIDQLVFEGFTRKQAEHGVSKTGL